MLAEVTYFIFRWKGGFYFMENKKGLFFKKVGDFIKKYVWAFAIGAGVLAIAFLFLPILKYEIREAVYDIATDEKANYVDYLFKVNLIDYFSNGYKSVYAVIIVIIFVALGIIFVALHKLNKDFMTVAGMMFLLAICMFLLIIEFFGSEEKMIMKSYQEVGLPFDSETQYFYVYYHHTYVSWGTALGIFFCSIAFALTALSNYSVTTRQIAEEGILLSMAFVLNLVKIPVGVTGGSINFQMLPLMIIALRHGPAHGFIAGGIVYGLLTCLTDGYGFACYPFDYLVGFGSVAIMGLFRNQIFGKDQEGYNVKGLIFIFITGTISTAVRYIGSNVSSIVVYDYTLEAALAYNSIYIPLSGLIATVAFMVLYSPLIRINKMYPVKSI